MNSSRPRLLSLSNFFVRLKTNKEVIRNGNSCKLWGNDSTCNPYFSSWIKNTLTPPMTWMTGTNNNNGNGGRRGNRGVGESTIMLQEGHDIQEVPVAVLRSDPDKEGFPRETGKSKTYVVLNAQEEAAFVDGFSSYHSPQQVLKMLDTIPSHEVTPFVSVSILRKLFELENNFGFRNEGKSWIISAENNQVETFTRVAIVSRLVETIISAENTSILLDALDILRCERQNHTHFENDKLNYWASASEEFSNYRNKLFEEILIRVAELKLSLEQVCRAVISLGKMEEDIGSKFSNDLIDKLWVGILEKNEYINTNNIVDVLRTVEYFNKSRRLVMNLVERKVIYLMWKMDTTLVAEICGILLMDKNLVDKKWRNVSENWGISNRLLSVLSKCVTLNIHNAKEEELLKIVRAFHMFNFCHPSIETALSKYMKTKCLKISDPQLVAVIMDYAKKFRLRSPHILEGALEYVILHNGSNLSPPQFSSILTSFGQLDFQPPNGIKFWEIVERTLDTKFIQFPPKDIVDLLLSCVYLVKYPLNFVDRVFSPYFLDRLHTSEKDITILQQIRSSLKLLDASFTIECGKQYRGPLLPKDFTAKHIFRDGRILRMIHNVQDPLAEICEETSIVEASVLLPNVPLNELYILDVMIKPKSHIGDKIFRHRINLTPNGRIRDDKISKEIIAVLINIPEHFSSDGKYLIGPQMMRIRHLNALGLAVVNLKYEILAELRVHPQAFNDYLRESLAVVGYPGVLL